MALVLVNSSRNLLIWSTDNSVQFWVLTTLPLANGLAILTWHKLVCVVWANDTKRPSVRDISVASVKLQTQTTINVVDLLGYPTVAWQEPYTCQWGDHRSLSFVCRCNYGIRFGPNLLEVAHCDWDMVYSRLLWGWLGSTVTYLQQTKELQTPTYTSKGFKFNRMITAA